MASLHLQHLRSVPLLRPINPRRRIHKSTHLTCTSSIIPAQSIHTSTSHYQLSNVTNRSGNIGSSDSATTVTSDIRATTRSSIDRGGWARRQPLNIRKTTQLKTLLKLGHTPQIQKNQSNSSNQTLINHDATENDNKPGIQFLMEAHNGMSARIVEEAGFAGIWGSGLSISASMCLRDSNEASYTQVLDVCEQMSDVTDIPLLLDADTGYGNFNNARLLVRKLEKRGIAGACIEDKLFPKSNSLLSDSEAKPLASIEEFTNKIRAMKDIQQDSDFVVVARVESFIAGWPLEEALKRADAYANAGADAILMHSKKNTDEDIRSFMKHWNQRVPVIVVPTKYYTTPTAELQDMGVSTIIWANHNMRASIRAMQEVTRQIYRDKNLVAVEENDKVVPVKEVFRLQDQSELNDAEKHYLPRQVLQPHRVATTG